MNARQFKTISEYLITCYENGFLGAMYDLHGQGIPIIVPIAQNQVVAALTKESKLSKTLYDSLGEDVTVLKKKVRQEVSRGLASGLGYTDISRGIAARMVGDYRKFSGGKLYCAERIARTEGHTIQNHAALDAQGRAKEKGADIVKQWDATLDGRTRPDHRAADGQLREVDEDFDVGGEKMPAPGIGGSAKNVVHCRCALLQRARWALDEDELETLKELAEYFGLDKTKDFDEFREKYLKASDVQAEPGAKGEPVKTAGKKDLQIDSSGGIMNQEDVEPMIHAIEQPIEQRNTGKGNPNAILVFDIELNTRQSFLLDRLPDFDSRITVPKNSVNMTDLAALTAKTGHEFAMFTKGQERLIIRGDEKRVNIHLEDALELAKAGYRWSGHTHPGTTIQCMIASGGDMLVLEQFPQTTSVIYNSKGQFATFGKEE